MNKSGTSGTSTRQLQERSRTRLLVRLSQPTWCSARCEQVAQDRSRNEAWCDKGLRERRMPIAMVRTTEPTGLPHACASLLRSMATAVMCRCGEGWRLKEKARPFALGINKALYARRDSI